MTIRSGTRRSEEVARKRITFPQRATEQISREWRLRANWQTAAGSRLDPANIAGLRTDRDLLKLQGSLAFLQRGAAKAPRQLPRDIFPVMLRHRVDVTLLRK